MMFAALSAAAVTSPHVKSHIVQAHTVLLLYHLKFKYRHKYNYRLKYKHLHKYRYKYRYRYKYKYRHKYQYRHKCKCKHEETNPTSDMGEECTTHVSLAW